MKMSMGIPLILVVASVFIDKSSVNANPITEVDCDTMIVQLRELYRILMANGGLPSFHELVRKAQRIPSLRLRFGKRSLPAWIDPVLSEETVKE